MGLFSVKNPADAAMPYLNQIPGVAQENLGPWAQQGQQAQMQNQAQYSQMVNSPSDFYAQLRATYSPSAGYKFKEEQARKAMEGSAAAGGRVGTTANQTAQAKLAKDLLAEDENAYIDRLLGIQGTGLQGNEFAAQRGFGASGDITNILGTNLSEKAGLAYNQQQNENDRKNAWLRALFVGGGALLGGIPGAAIGGQMGSAYAGSSSRNPGPSNYEQLGLGMGGRY